MMIHLRMAGDATAGNSMGAEGLSRQHTGLPQGRENPSGSLG